MHPCEEKRVFDMRIFVKGTDKGNKVRRNEREKKNQDSKESNNTQDLRQE